MQNLEEVFTFSALALKHTFWTNLVSKNQNCYFKLKFDTQTNSNVHSSVVVSTFFFFFWNINPKIIKIDSLSCNLVTRLIRMYRMFILFVLDQKYFLGKFGPNNQNRQFKLNFGTQTNFNMQNSMVMFTFSVFDWKYPFWKNLIQKSKLSV